MDQLILPAVCLIIGFNLGVVFMRFFGTQGND